MRHNGVPGSLEKIRLPFMAKLHLRVASVIFDMDGVITNTMPDHYRSWREVLSKEGIPVTHHDIYCREGQPGIHSVREIFKMYGKSYSGRDGRRILDAKEELFKEIARLRFIAGARSFLKRLHRGKFRLALVTGTSRHELCRILPEGLRDLFSVIVTGSDVRHGKPHPEPYLKSLRQLKLKKADAVVIENAPFGIQSAKRAGLRCLAVETSLPKEYLAQADGVFGSIQELQSKVCFLYTN